VNSTKEEKPKALLQTDRYVALMVFLAGLPAVVVALAFLWSAHWDLKSKITLSLPVLICWYGFAAAGHRRVERSLLTLSNILTSLREGDYSLRARARGQSDALAELTREVNRLGDTLKQQRRNETEATLLLTVVMQEIEVALFAFDSAQRLRLANPAALRLLGVNAEQVLGRTATEVSLSDCLEGTETRVLVRGFPGGTGRWGLRRTPFYAEGTPHTLVVIADLSRTLREEELAAWQRLVRVLGHEINNSLTPIKSIAGSLRTQVERGGPEVSADFAEGLGIIESRAHSLGQFIESYARLARLPEPTRRPVPVRDLLLRIRNMDTRVEVGIGALDTTLRVDADPALLEQALINLLRNAVDAALASHESTPSRASVNLEARALPGSVRIEVTDNGFGPPESVNLFVPFFTTKPGGSGIGLVLSRQIAESHGGTLELERISDQGGCRAVLCLPTA
jgi:two-component system, NtrC family, nitrogen regulation sensor histidine kinase NtrY